VRIENPTLVVPESLPKMLALSADLTPVMTLNRAVPRGHYYGWHRERDERRCGCGICARGVRTEDGRGSKWRGPPSSARVFDRITTRKRGAWVGRGDAQVDAANAWTGVRSPETWTGVHSPKTWTRSCGKMGHVVWRSKKCGQSVDLPPPAAKR
jgi:hypothetical protein